jgi:hypothetical protein
LRPGGVVKSTDVKDAVSRSIDTIGGGHGALPVDPELYTMEHGVTQSLIHGFLACRRQLQLVLQGWRLPSTKAAMTYGGIYHDLLEQLYLAIIAKKLTRKGNFRAFAKKHTKAWLKKHGKRLRHGGDLKMALEQTAKVCAVFPAYCKFHQGDFTKIKWQELEGVFDLVWKGFRIRGRWDGLYKLAKEYWLLETKTKSQVNAEKVKEALAFDFQSMFYITALTQHRQLPIEGVLYNVIRNPGLRQGKKESSKAFIRRIAADAKERKEFYFMRFEATFPEETRAEFERELLWILQEMKDWLEGKIHTFKNGGSCIRRFTCEYMAACSSGTMAGYRSKGQLFTELL